MSHMATMLTGFDGITVGYLPGGTYSNGSGLADSVIPSTVLVELTGFGPKASLALSIADARALLEALPGVLARHDAAESAASASAVGEAA